MTVFAGATSGQRKDALHVWCAARTADGNPPSKARIDRVRGKLADTDASLLVGCDGELVVAMGLSEPYRECHGAGAVRPHTGHVSMVFVDPECWGRGVGSRLLDALHREMRARDWRTSSLWTRSNNERARRLYEGRGYSLTDDVKYVRDQEIVRYELQIEGSF
ncbi:MAG TPA: GNAT family N-acetyltransferase [Solirubrobacterales bacterium]|nr:GNAT family N-acetyltransferase [Solirubrobacterales bacterium]